jgi:hypothetical protein
MKKIYMILLLFITTLLTICYSQDCGKNSKLGNCAKTTNKNYKTYLQPQYSSIGVNDTLVYNIVFSGNKDYIISFCAQQKYFPLYIRLLEADTWKEIYNNENDDYCESLGIGFYETQNIRIEIVMLAEKLGTKKVQCKDRVCIELSMQYKKIVFKLE